MGWLALGHLQQTAGEQSSVGDGGHTTSCNPTVKQVARLLFYMAQVVYMYMRGCRRAVSNTRVNSADRRLLADPSPLFCAGGAVPLLRHQLRAGRRAIAHSTWRNCTTASKSEAAERRQDVPL